MFVIRQANIKDVNKLPVIEASAAQSFRGHPQFNWIAEGDVQSEQDHIEYVQQQMEWVAVDNDDLPIGFINTQKLENSLHINEVSVCHIWQGKGIGKQLIQHILAYAQEQGIPFVSLTTFRDIPWNAPYYQRLGFRLLGESDLSEELKSILQEEVEAGFNAQDRCAMVISVTV
ncbi:GNAT family N-acetyltransferase [Providencia sneebia]|uniref:N-acetyltransferase GCN5 n=1 Tax=Providencia sneebia DSM 19967 TaxID=1141660 RepID=K8W6Z2_9GAMM|nr:GNAT family N-acetyltransferase [Providencia sneebia]EKT55646.1 N-acetyltransferase GCN5 [Providencia sneebia DSM 19967]